MGITIKFTERASKMRSPVERSVIQLETKMIAGEVLSFVGSSDMPEVEGTALLELTEWSEKYIELAATVGKRRVYFKFRMDDLVREIKEYGEVV